MWRFISDWYFRGEIKIEYVFEKIKNNDMNYVKKFIEEHPYKINQIDSDGKTCLMAACHRSNTHLINLLVKSGAHLDTGDKGGKTALHYAVLECQLPAVLILLFRGSNVNVKDKDDFTPLHLAALKGKEWKDVVAALLQKKGEPVNVNSRDIIGQTPLYYACSRGHKDTVRFLLNHPGIEPNIANNCGVNALYAAVQEQHYDVVALMLSQNSVELEMKNHIKLTPFLLAVSRGHLGIIRKFVERGAEIAAPNNEGNNCLHLAVQKDAFHSEDEPLDILDKFCIDLGLRKEDRLSGVVVASYLAHQGVDFYCKNRNGLAPLDLVENANLKVKIMMLFPPQCRWCQKKKATVTLHPCQHIVLCENCCPEMTFKRCPMCQQCILRRSGFGNPMFQNKKVQTTADTIRNPVFQNKKVQTTADTIRRPKSVTKQVQTVESQQVEAPMMEEQGVQTMAQAAVKPNSVTKQVQTVAPTLESKSLQVEILTCAEEVMATSQQVERTELKEKDLLRVAKRLGDKWWQVGILLGTETTELELDDNSNDTVKQAYKMLYEWFTSCDPETRTLETLSATLEEAECFTALECLSSNTK